ncbi:hypothetical protein BDP27DRAFT_1432151 [Rhodocollybia butyracea]|uniref:Uncharacterized protein n=1 Tax=Rhodocollybia butyracea TaxID=206335 RepID=A0A9P5TYX5_9AGAR|nr:hypothetical protein BDP27DRAFT_1432151 [Rhodocollybia butyracea]
MFADHRLLSTTPWSLFNDHLIIEVAFSGFVIAKHTSWKDSPATRELELALGDLAETVRKLRKTSKWFPFIPRFLLPDFNTFVQNVLDLYTARTAFIDLHDEGNRSWAELHLGSEWNKATPTQWNMRAQLSYSASCYRNSVSYSMASYTIQDDDPYRPDHPGNDEWTPIVPHNIPESIVPNIFLPKACTHPICSKCKQALPPCITPTLSSSPPPPYTASPSTSLSVPW